MARLSIQSDSASNQQDHYLEDGPPIIVKSIIALKGPLWHNFVVHFSLSKSLI
jgi:hypothetical protein